MTRALSRRSFNVRASSVMLATPFLSLVGCDRDEVDDLVSFDGPTMGTTYSVKLARLPGDIDPALLAGEIDAVLEGVNQRMSTYRPESELSRFNSASQGQWTPVSDHTLTVVERSRRLHQLTGGAFDPTVGPVVDLWGFGPDGGQDRVPPADDIALASEMVGFAKVESRSEGSALRKQAPGVRLDLSGVAKGFAVDLVADHLEESGIENYLVEVGGELRASGARPGGRSWRVGIEKPTLASGDIQQIVDLNGEAMATSGNYRIFFERDGRRYAHIVNPRTGRPIEHDLASVTVLAPTTLEADALSTALLVLGRDDGMALAREQNITAFFISGSEGAFAEAASPAFSRRAQA